MRSRRAVVGAWHAMPGIDAWPHPIRLPRSTKASGSSLLSPPTKTQVPEGRLTVNDCRQTIRLGCVPRPEAALGNFWLHFVFENEYE